MPSDPTIPSPISPTAPESFHRCLRRHGVKPSRDALVVNIAKQRMEWFVSSAPGQDGILSARYEFRRRFVVSTSRFGIGQVMHSNCTPLGLHRVARKVGGGYPLGAIFKARQLVGYTWQGQPDGTIVHRILWLEGLDPGFNRGGAVDTFRRYIYIHGFGDETTLGRPQSHGCIHLSATDILPLYDRLPIGTLVWIADR